MAPGVKEGYTIHPHCSSISSLRNRQISGYFVEYRLPIHSDRKFIAFGLRIDKWGGMDVCQLYMISS